jgi:DNA-binding transcriptional LysR family regulator
VLNPRQIEAFRAVVSTGGVTSAARALNMSQPAVTRLIRDFQHAVGLTLFVRQGVRLIPTENGTALYREVERQYVGLEQIAKTAHDLRERRIGSLRIAALPAFAAGILPRFVAKFLAGRPGLDISLYGSISSQVVEWVASGYCDVGFAEGPVVHAGIDVGRLPAAPAVAVMPAGHRLAAKSAIRPPDLAGEPFVSVGQSSQFRFRIESILAAEGVAVVTRVETPLSMIACALVAAGTGVAIVDPYTAHEFRTHGIVVRPFLPSVEFEIACLTPLNRPGPELAGRFVVDFREALAEFSPRVDGSSSEPRARPVRRARR